MIPEQIDQLIIARLSGEETQEEAKELDLWLRQSEANQKLYREYENLWSETRKLYQHKEPNLEACLNQFEKVCYHRERKIYSWIRYAAVILLPLALALGIYILQQPEPQLAENILAPNQHKVQLLLSNGQKLNLAANQHAEFRESQGIKINQQGNTLNYEAAEEETKTTSGEVQYNTLIIPRGAEYSLILADGTKIYLNSESELRYPVKFSGNERRVFLKGEAYFDVTTDKTKPFIVNAQELDIQVLGTAFNIMAYQDVPQIETTLERGCVKVEGAGKQLILHPGMQAVLKKSDATLSSHEVNTELYTSWKEDKMIFENMQMEELLQKLSRWYDFNVFYQNPKTKTIRLTGHISKHETISTMLELLETMGKVKFNIKERNITVSESAN